MVSNPALARTISSVGFGALSGDEVKHISVKRVTNSSTFDSLLHPLPGGLYDPAFGAFLDNP